MGVTVPTTILNRQTSLPEHESYLLCPGRQPMQIPPNHNVSNRIRLNGVDKGTLTMTRTSRGRRWRTKGSSMAPPLSPPPSFRRQLPVLKDNALTTGQTHRNNNSNSGTSSRSRSSVATIARPNQNNNRPPPSSVSEKRETGVLSRRHCQCYNNHSFWPPTKHIIIDIYHWINR